MEFNEKLQELRKRKGLTQEELAEALYVSRTAISKWESGRGYPSIDSLKEISKFFSVSLDELLSGERLLSIAEKENKANLQSMCDLLWGMLDLCSGLLIVLPLYSRTAEGYIYSVNLPAYTEATVLNRLMFWTLFLLLVMLGGWKVLLTQLQKQKMQTALTSASMIVGIAAVLSLALAREAYAVTLAFLLLTMKTILLFKYRRADT